MRTKWVDMFITALSQEGVPCEVLKRVSGWPETLLISERYCFTKSITFNEARCLYFQGVDPGKLDESGDLVVLCGGADGLLRDIFLIPWLDFFGAISQGQPINTYRLPKIYYQYKFRLQFIEGEWIMKVQGTHRTAVVNVTPWHCSPEYAVEILKSFDKGGQPTIS